MLHYYYKRRNITRIARDRIGGEVIAQREQYYNIIHLLPQIILTNNQALLR